ncbi:MAG TPA: ABC transporter substrate-binding protein, partial [Frankiaceae bacterium]|nr:ABC transporter substrate-binding protein [Frankiaceae bacterium]
RGRDPYATAGSHGNPGRCRDLLARAGRPGLDLVVLQPDTPTAAAVTNALAASFARAGVHLSPLVVPAADAVRRLTDPAGGWDLAVPPAYRPPWSGAAGRAVFQPLLDPWWVGPKPVDTGYRGPALPRSIDAALAATGPTEVADRWAALDAAVQADAPLVPLVAIMTARFHGANVRNWVLLPVLGNGDPTNVALGVT